MKKFCLIMLLCLCPLLSGCGGEEFSDAREELARQLDESQSLSFTANVRAEYEHKTARFTLSYSQDEEGGIVTVLAPQLIAGVTARVEPDSASLVYDGICLGTGELDDYGLSPMSSLPMLVQALETGAMNSGWNEGNCLVLELQSSDELICTVWFEPEEMIPLQAELMSDGRVKVFAEISDWQPGQKPALPEPAAGENTEEAME